MPTSDMAVRKVNANCVVKSFWRQIKSPWSETTQFRMKSSVKSSVRLMYLIRRMVFLPLLHSDSTHTIYLTI